MVVRVEGLVRDAGRGDIAAICQFGEAHIRSHYAPLIGAPAADAQVRRWWNEVAIDAGFAVERVEPSASGSPALDVVWRARPLGA
ncbi:hypothetical protein [Cellulomonas timonensis]|uniref:hypothetical protein n=1 Tax=Cellulomonas timonensis TaxID=1689271 RepID=UPI000830F628|nr:hypothetical protein [Cellulomonas timonensis]